MKKSLRIISLCILCLTVVLGLSACRTAKLEGEIDAPSTPETSTAPSWAADLVKGDGKTVLLGADTDYPPFEFATEDGTGFEGFEVDLMNAVGEKLGLDFQFKTYDFDAITTGLAGGTEFDMVTSAFTITPDRAKEVDFGLPYFMDSFGVAVPLTSKITSVSDITKDTRVAVQSSSSAYEWCLKNLPTSDKKYVLNEDTATLFQSMQAGEADVLIQDYSSAANFATDPVREAKIVQRLDGTEQYFGMAFQKNEKGSAMKLSIDTALQDLVADGTYGELYTKWFGVSPDFTPGQKTTDEVLAAALK